MLRQAIFVLVLVGAAFAGGAAINGPGLAWLQRNLIGGPTIIVDGSAPADEPGRAAKRFPTASGSTLTFPVAASAGNTPSKDRPTPPTTTFPPATANPSDSSDPGLLGLPGPAGPDPAALAAAATIPPATTDPASPLDLPALDLPLEAPTASATTPPTTSVPKSDPITRLASTEGLDSTLSPASTDPTPLSPGRDWTEIRQRLKGLGVSRYNVDAELEGRVRFSCVIPVDGLRAVGHHFEADGDDIFQAVDATIRRITLWRATEPARADP